VEKAETFRHAGGGKVFSSPGYSEDITLRDAANKREMKHYGGELTHDPEYQRPVHLPFNGTFQRLSNFKVAVCV
jgi:hypothetical protein